MLSAVAVSWALFALVVLEKGFPPQIRDAFHALTVPVTPASFGGFLEVWTGRLAGLALFILMQAGCLAMGKGVSALVSPGRRSSAMSCLPIGWLTLGLVMYGLSLSGLAFRSVLGAAAFGAGFFGLHPLICSARRWRNTIPDARINRLILAAGALVTVVMFLTALAPEVEVDALTYNYANPLRILSLGRQVEWPFSIADDLPALWEMLLLPLLAAGGEAATRWFNPFLAVFMAMLVYRILGGFTGRSWALAAAVLLVTNPYMVRQASTAKNDMLAAAMALSVLAQVLAAGKGRLVPACAVAGILSGGAFVTKYNAGLVLAAVPVSLAVMGRLNAGRVLALVAGFAVAATPSLLRNGLMTGNPLFPFASSLFPSPFFSEIARSQLHTNMFVVTLQDPGAISRWLSVKAAIGAGSDESFMRWLALLPCVFLAAWRAPQARVVLASLLVMLAGWMAGPPQVRYGLAAFPLGVMAGAYGLSGLRVGRMRDAAGWIAGLAIVLQVAHACANTKTGQAIRAGIGLETAEGYRMRVLTSYETAVRAVNRLAGPTDRVFSHGESRTAPLTALSYMGFFGDAVFPPFAMVKASRTPDEVWKKFRQQGWTLLLYNRISAFFWSRSLSADPWTERELNLWAVFWREHAEAVWESPSLDLMQGYYYLFRIYPHSPGAPRAVLPGVEGWVRRVEEARQAGQKIEMRDCLDALRRAAGDFGVIDRVEADMSGPAIPRDRVRFLLNRAVSRGFRSPPVYLHLAAMARADGDHAGAARWIKRAEELEPGSSRR